MVPRLTQLARAPGVVQQGSGEVLALLPQGLQEGGGGSYGGVGQDIAM